MKNKIALLLVIACVTLVPTFSQTSGTWTATTQTANSTENPTATLLQTGKVLVAGGDLGTIILQIKNAQLFDPVTNGWTATGKMTSVRGGHSGVLLPNGQVLIAGGTNGAIGSNGYDLVILKTAELYDPSAGRFTATGKMAGVRMYHSAVLLPNGRVLVSGGLYTYKPRLRYAVATNSAELFDPATGIWSSAGNMSVARAYHSSTVMPDGKVLVVGAGTADIYDPATNSWMPTTPPASKYTGSPAVVLPNGKVLVASATTSAELYDPSTATWSPTGALASAHTGGMVLLATGKALIYGPQAAELYDPISNTWSVTGSLISSRTGAPITLLPDGRALVTAGSPVWWNGEVYTP